MSQHPVIFIGSLRCRAAVLSVVSLDCQTAKIDTLAAKIETAIEHLQEYHSALVTAAVTGKIDMREKAAL